MSKSDFHVDFYSEIENVPASLEIMANDRLRELGENYIDMIGASVGLDEVTGKETPHGYEARVVAYIKPSNIAATKQAEDLETALQQALSALERQVWDHRERIRDAHRKPQQVAPPIVEEE